MLYRTIMKLWLIFYNNKHQRIAMNFTSIATKTMFLSALIMSSFSWGMSHVSKTQIPALFDKNQNIYLVASCYKDKISNIRYGSDNNCVCASNNQEVSWNDISFTSTLPYTGSFISTYLIVNITMNCSKKN